MLPFIPQSIYNRILTIGNVKDSSSSYRITIWTGVLKMLKENQKCSPNATKLEDVDEAVLETVIQKWEQFKDFLELPF